MYKKNKIVNISLLFFVILVKAIIAKESDFKAEPASVIRTIPHPDCLPLYSQIFDCFKGSSIITNNHLLIQHSRLVRRTILSLMALIDYTPGQLFAEKFTELKVPINKCVAISNNWSHVSGPLFHDLQAIEEKARLQKGLRDKVCSVFNTFVASLEQATMIDGLELRLLCIPAHKSIDVRMVQTIAQRLKELNREEIAAHYLFSFGKQVRDSSTAHTLCAEARKFGAKEAPQLSMSLFTIGDVLHGGIERLKRTKLDDIEMALRFVSVDADEQFVLALVDHLIKAKRKEVAIHYLLDIADQFRTFRRSKDPKSDYVLPELYYIKAEKLGSVEAIYKRLKWQRDFDSIRSSEERKYKRRESSSRSISSTYHDDSLSASKD